MVEPKFSTASYTSTQMERSAEVLLVIASICAIRLLLAIPVATAYEPDRIPQFPGQPSGHNFSQYGGYVTINATSGKKFYYIFVEATEMPEEKPLVLWLNGGPGCSSVYGGFFQEHGPWRLKNWYSNELVFNPYSWNTQANMIYLETPAGVGFSFSKTSADYKTNDHQTATDNYMFLYKWFTQKFPQYKNHDFYITGESYAGKYVPQLAWQVLQRNAKPQIYKDATPIKLKGIMIGNPYIVSEDTLGFTLRSFALRFIVPTGLVNFLLSDQQCSADYYSGDYSGASKECLNAVNEIHNQIGNVDFYDMNGDVCMYLGEDTGGRRLPHRWRRGEFRGRGSKDMFMKRLKRRMNLETGEGDDVSSTDAEEARLLAEAAAPSSAVGIPAPSTVPRPLSVSNPACNGFWIERYMNDLLVQKAIHANVSGEVFATTYTDCSGEAPTKTGYLLQYTDDTADTIHEMQELLRIKLKVWLYSGDTDTVVPPLETLSDIKRFNTSKATSWREWYYYDQAGGWTSTFNNGLRILTVRNAGHLVPIRQPERAVFMFKRFLLGADLPKTWFSLDYGTYEK